MTELNKNLDSGSSEHNQDKATCLEHDKRVSMLESRVRKLEQYVLKLKEATLKQRQEIAALSQMPSGSRHSSEVLSLDRDVPHSDVVATPPARKLTTSSRNHEQAPSPPLFSNSHGEDVHDAELPSRQLSVGPLSIEAATPIERFAKISIWSIAGLAVLTSLAAFASGVNRNASARDLLLAFLLLPIAPLSYFGFVLGIARYRSRIIAISFTLTCCTIATLFLCVMIWALHDRPQPPPWFSLWVVASFSLMAGSCCLIFLRVGESIGNLFTQQGKYYGTRIAIPKSKRILVSLVLLWGGLFQNAAMALSSSSNPADMFGRAIYIEILTWFSGAVVSQLPLILVVTIPIVIVYTVTLLVPSLRAPRITRYCVPAYVALTLFSLIVEPFLAIGLAFRRGDYGDYLVGGTVEGAKSFLPLPVQIVLSLLPAGLWIVGGVMIGRAIRKEMKDQPTISENSIDVYNSRPLSGRVVQILKAGGISMGVNFAISILLVTFGVLLSSELASTIRKESILFPAWIVGLTMAYPVPSVTAVTAFAIRNASREMRLSWEPWELASRTWIDHVVLGMAVSISFGLFVGVLGALIGIK